MGKVRIAGFGEVGFEKGDVYEALLQYHRINYVVAVKVNGLLKELSCKIEDGAEVEFVGVEDADGAKVYQRSLTLLMIRAAREVIHNAKVKVSHSLSKGLYCTINKGSRHVTHDECNQIKALMRDYVRREIPIIGSEFKKNDAEAVFKKQRMDSKVKILKYREEDHIRLYEIDGFYDYFYGYMVPNTKYLPSFDLIKYGDGVILAHPTHFSPDEIPVFEETPKMAKVFEEMDHWLELLGIPYIYNLNDMIKKQRHKELILIAEALQEKKIAEIADEITRGNKKVILIAGPSSSGKTTFANRLGIQLRVNGL
ncbi:MAG: nucleoside kinase, partial [Bacillota bacterium]|nr:nucleoside kinase [Bacillota bacterium]